VEEIGIYFANNPPVDRLVASYLGFKAPNMDNNIDDIVAEFGSVIKIENPR
jgi:hypothetical protein